jgi:two-component system, OmpR family, sensor histidine kinase BaeS
VRAHLLVAMIGLALVSVGATALLMNRAVDGELAKFAQHDLRLSADDAAESAAAVYLEAGRWSPRSVRALRTVARGRGDAIAVVGPRGRPVPGSPVAAPGATGARAAVVVRGRLVGTVIATHPPHGGVDTAAQRLDRQLRGRMDGLLAQAGGLAALIGLLLALVVALRMARPLERLTEVARRMEAGHIETRATGSGGGREMTRLAHTMDRLAAALRRQEELRRATVADVSHELRGALVGVVARIEALRDGVAQDPEGVLVRMEGDARRVHRLVDDIGRLVDAQRPALMLERRPIDVAEVVRAAVERREATCRALSIGLTASVAPVRVEGDPARLAQVLDNLLSNAVRYTDEGGRVSVRVERRGAHAAIEVADTGIGIAPEHVARVFDRFWRARAASARAPEGSGVGLAVVSEIVRAHGGRVEVASRPGGGSTFTVLLARAVPRPPAAPAHGAPARGALAPGAAADAAPSAPGALAGTT